VHKRALPSHTRAHSFPQNIVGPIVPLPLRLTVNDTLLAFVSVFANLVYMKNGKLAGKWSNHCAKAVRSCIDSNLTFKKHS
jgi:hypothetical protein